MEEDLIVSQIEIERDRTDPQPRTRPISDFIE